MGLKGVLSNLRMATMMRRTPTKRKAATVVTGCGDSEADSYSSDNDEKHMNMSTKSCASTCASEHGNYTEEEMGNAFSDDDTPSGGEAADDSQVMLDDEREPSPPRPKRLMFEKAPRTKSVSDDTYMQGMRRRSWWCEVPGCTSSQEMFAGQAKLC